MNKAYSLTLSEEESDLLEQWAQEDGRSPEDCVREALRRAAERPADGAGLMAVADRIHSIHRDAQMQLMSCHRDNRDLCDGCRALNALLRDVRTLLCDVKQAALSDTRFAWRKS